MKKLLLVTLALAVIALAPSETTTTQESEIHLHSHAEAAWVTWQCKKCGERIYGSNQPPDSTYWCGGVFENKHVWERLN